MKKLSIKQIELKNDLVQRLANCVSEINDSIYEANSRITEFNDIANEANEFIDSITSDMATYYDERTDKWKESDAGQAFDAWKDEWDNLRIDDITDIDNVDDEYYEFDNAEESVGDL